jgi:hypothetical protein
MPAIINENMKARNAAAEPILGTTEQMFRRLWGPEVVVRLAKRSDAGAGDLLLIAHREHSYQLYYTAQRGDTGRWKRYGIFGQVPMRMQGRMRGPGDTGRSQFQRHVFDGVGDYFGCFWRGPNGSRYIKHAVVLDLVALRKYADVLGRGNQEWGQEVLMPRASWFHMPDTTYACGLLPFQLQAAHPQLPPLVFVQKDYAPRTLLTVL